MKPLGLYLHIPFCVRKCLYCDFVSYAGKEARLPEYFAALRREWEWYRRQEWFAEYSPATLYVGGGTPSLATAELLQIAKMLFGAPLREATIEVNPGTITLAQLQQLRQAGFNRLSIGVQSLHDGELKILGRIHTRAEAIACYQAARQAGFRNINLDLIFGIPGATLESWQATLQAAIALEPEHLSTYNLTLEAGTPFWELRQRGQLRLPDEDQQLEMYQTGIAALTQAGYEHYEISNFARPGQRCQHNQIYWRNEAYLGLGAGAHSYLNGCRYWNYADLETYWGRSAKALLWRPKQSFGTPSVPATVAGSERLDLAGEIGETVMLNLRLLDGLDLTAFQQRFGQSLATLFAKPLDKLRALDLVELAEQRLRLTPKGICLSNEVFQEFIFTTPPHPPLLN